MIPAAHPSSIDADTLEQYRDRPGARTADYFPRQMRITDEQESWRTVSEAEILEIAGSKIVLGEPGMGKSELVHELGRMLNVPPVTAIRFMHSKNPEQYAVPGKPLLIDGLDEAMARREGDAVDVILAQLEAAGSPDFILSCRAREWQSRSATNLRQIYGADPTVLTLEPLSRKEAAQFLVQRYPKADSEHVLIHLNEHGISDLYGNPLTLGLMGKVAEIDTKLPATRGALFDRICTLIWPEHDPDRQDTSLGTITEDQALSAAGAIMAGLLLAGADAASLSGPMQLQEGDIRIADLERLPGAGAARVMFSSKLFHSSGVGRARPIHRVVAEFLGARWLAQQTTTKRTQRRLLAQLHGSGAVPASLRGLHAWLAYHSSTMAKAVIAADPFGVLRYGETASLTNEQADYLFDALQSLGETNPYFRGQDWDCHAATGLMIRNLQSKIQATIARSDSNTHLRSLLIEALIDSPLSRDIASTLEKVILSSEHFYHERKSAADALLPYRERSWWQQTIKDLLDQGTEDSNRLARNTIEEIDCEVTDGLLVATIFAELGVTMCALPRGKKQRHSFRDFSRIAETLPTTRVVNVLNLLSEHAFLLQNNDWQNWRDLAEMVSSLIARGIQEKVVQADDAALLWRWLETLQHAQHFNGENKQLLQALLDEHENLRRAIQQHALYVARPRSTIWMSEVDLRWRMVGLAAHPKDVAWFLERLGDSNNKDLSLRGDWCDLMRLGIGREGFDPALREASHKFQRGDIQLQAFVRKLEYPKKSTWVRNQERRQARQERKKRVTFEFRRRRYAGNKSALREGELELILDPAMAYLGLIHELSGKAAADRVAGRLGTELADDAMTGFEAVLHRVDLPSPEQIADGFAKRETWSYSYPIMAGLLARQRANRGFKDLTANILKTGLLLCHDSGRCFCIDDDLAALIDELDRHIIPDAVSRENFARLWIEPSLANGVQQIPGLYKLAHDQRWLATGATLAPTWLMTYSNVPEAIELALVNCLTHGKALASLASVASERAKKGFASEQQRLAWLAIDVLVRFDSVQSSLSNIGAKHPEFIWYLRDRFQIERRGAMLPIATEQAKWIVSQFRTQWPYAVHEGSGSGDTNPYDATDFLRAMIHSIADDTSIEASDAMQELIGAAEDRYSDLIRHMAAEQRQKRAEENFVALRPKQLDEILAGGPPSNMDDLKSIVLEELADAQRILLGDDLDQVRDFWDSAGIPYDENRCRDRLAAMIGPELMRYEVQRITEADMPQNKRADLAFSRGKLQLPMEVKGQWHPKVWEAATDQLDHQYLLDWRSEQRGIYCVLWFGNMPSMSGKRLKAPPKGLEAPKTAEELCRMLRELIPEGRRSLIDVVVLDCSAGKP